VDEEPKITADAAVSGGSDPGEELLVELGDAATLTLGGGGRGSENKRRVYG
jgi:hypothetical protein